MDTHPYAKNQLGQYPTGVSLSGGDAAALINTEGLNFIMAQSGDQQFMFLRTAKTPDRVDALGLSYRADKAIAKIVASGSSFSSASRTVAAKVAQEYGLAYYEGQNGNLKKVGP